MLITPVWITVAPLTALGTAADYLAREGVWEPIVGAEVTLLAQLDYVRRAANADHPGGGQLVHQAQLTVERAAADGVGWTPQRGDQITAIEDVLAREDAAVLYVTSAIPRGFWFGGASTIVIETEGRHPSQPALRT